jgi:hypothetical protein
VDALVTDDAATLDVDRRIAVGAGSGIKRCCI